MGLLGGLLCLLVTPFMIIAFILVGFIVTPIVMLFLSLYCGKSEPGRNLGGIKFAYDQRAGLGPKIAFVMIWILGKTFTFVEELFIRHKIDEIDRKLKEGEIPVVYIIGHPRSGTTNCHECLLERVHGAQCCQLVNLVKSLSILWWIEKIINCCDIAKIFVGVNDSDTANHPISPDMPTEDAMHYIRWGKSVSCMGVSGPHVWNSKETIDKMESFTVEDWEYIRREIARNMVLRGVPDIYVGCCVERIDYDIFFKIFGNIRLICMLRDPVKTHISWINLIKELWKTDPSALQVSNDVYGLTKPIYQNMLELTKTNNEKIYYLEFLDWVKNMEVEFNKLMKWLGHEGTFKPKEKGERHKNSDDLWKLFPKEKIEEEVGPLFQGALQNSRKNMKDRLLKSKTRKA